MFSIFKLTLVLAAVVCVSVAQLYESKQQCLCQRLRNGIPKKSEVKDIQIYPATMFCDKVEIIVTQSNGLRYCLNPELKAVRKRLDFIIYKKRQSTSTTAQATPFSGTSNPSSSNTARN
ncbi:C-X-C motif chemokine 10-like [Scomber japonicus]|uniref:C-X-C motif chemokine 10-like n=1 Tax=Scomber japonicus TaxID=13676 RepID=UPI002305327E|nr:C-X-C motif chemokine 10-like [Scomber japonicus]